MSESDSESSDYDCDREIESEWAGYETTLLSTFSPSMLYDAVDKRRPVTFIQQLLKDPKIDINWINPDRCGGNTALSLAACYGNKEVVQLLLQVNADLNHQDTHGYTALNWAAYNGQTAVVQVLIQTKAALDLQNQDGKTALMWAAYHGKTEVTQMLVQAKADLDLQDKKGYTALKWGTSLGKAGVVQVLQDALEAREASVALQVGGYLPKTLIQLLCQYLCVL